MSEEVFIPENLDQCFEEIPNVMLSEEVDELKGTKEDNVSVNYHHNFGRFLRNRWGLWEDDSKLKEWFVSIGIKHPDDMSGIIIKSFWRHLNGKDIDLEKQVKYYQDYWDSIKVIEQ